NRRFLPEPIGARLFLTKHCFVKPSGHARMYALGLHVAWIAKCNVFTAFLKKQTLLQQGFGFSTSC
ncbi:MAG TPA: hypothetical protein VG962_04875, partial [Steroidobacteraceae bacterium]|nr:hypothetical protein [Steroidobacteraceae bacterium]